MAVFAPPIIIRELPNTESLESRLRQTPHSKTEHYGKRQKIPLAVTPGGLRNDKMYERKIFFMHG